MLFYIAIYIYIYIYIRSGHVDDEFNKFTIFIPHIYLLHKKLRNVFKVHRKIKLLHTFETQSIKF